MKKYLFSILVLASSFSFSQVGIGTIDPKVSLDVVGIPADVTAMDGIKLPQMTLSQLYNKTYPNSIYENAQIGTTVYITDTSYSSGQTQGQQGIFKFIKATGPYTYNGTYWIPSAKSTNPISVFASTSPQALANIDFGKEFSINFSAADEVINNVVSVNIQGDTYFEILEDGSYEIYGYIGFNPNLVFPATNINDFLEVEVFIDYLSGTSNVLNDIAENSYTIQGAMISFVNFLEVAPTTITLKKGDKLYFKLIMQPQFTPGTIGSDVASGSLILPNTNFPNSNNATIDSYNGDPSDGGLQMQKYSKYFSIKKL